MKKQDQMMKAKFTNPGASNIQVRSNTPGLGKISVRAIALGRDLPGWLKAPRDTSRGFYAVNGQVQFKENRANCRNVVNYRA